VCDLSTECTTGTRHNGSFSIEVVHRFPFTRMIETVNSGRQGFHSKWIQPDREERAGRNTFAFLGILSWNVTCKTGRNTGWDGLAIQKHSSWVVSGGGATLTIGCPVSGFWPKTLFQKGLVRQPVDLAITAAYRGTR
jgi:hypothetical protein